MGANETADERYLGGSYLESNPSWHAEHSPQKAGWIHDMLVKHQLRPRTIFEVGCGAGEILVELQRRLPSGTELIGYEISPQAFELCSPKARDGLRFELADLTAEPARCELLLVIDVIEHVEDYFSFLRSLHPKAELTMLHIPLDLSVQGLLRDRASVVREEVGHLHFFTREIALAALDDAGYEVLDWCYTSGSTELPGKGWKARLLRWPRRLGFRLAPELTVRVLGGYSLLVLAR